MRQVVLNNRFVPESRQAGRIMGRSRKHLHRELFTRIHMRRQIDLPHSALPDELGQAIAPYGGIELESFWHVVSLYEEPAERYGKSPFRRQWLHDPY
jgi:hypothetical protein